MNSFTYNMTYKLNPKTCVNIATHVCIQTHTYRLLHVCIQGTKSISLMHIKEMFLTVSSKVQIFVPEDSTDSGFPATIVMMPIIKFKLSKFKSNQYTINWAWYLLSTIMPFFDKFSNNLFLFKEWIWIYLRMRWEHGNICSAHKKVRWSLMLSML